MTDCRLTQVWLVNEKLVVADTIEDAISLYKKYYDNPIPPDITKVEAIANNSILKDYKAIIKETYKYKL